MPTHLQAPPCPNVGILSFELARLIISDKFSQILKDLVLKNHQVCEKVKKLCSFAGGFAVANLIFFEIQRPGMGGHQYALFF